MYNIYNNKNNIYKKEEENSYDGFRKEKRVIGKRLREKESISLKNHQATMALLISLPNTPSEKSRGR